MLFYVITRATGPTILVTVGIAIQCVTRMLLSRLLGLLKLLLELLQFLGGMVHAWVGQKLVNITFYKFLQCPICLIFKVIIG
jgi:hypothetical protein